MHFTYKKPISFLVVIDCITLSLLGIKYSSVRFINNNTLRLENSDRYSTTSYSFHMTSLIFAAGQGLSAMESKALSGHRSDSLVQ